MEKLKQALEKVGISISDEEIKKHCSDLGLDPNNVSIEETRQFVAVIQEKGSLTIPQDKKKIDKKKTLEPQKNPDSNDSRLQGIPNSQNGLGDAYHKMQSEAINECRPYIESAEKINQEISTAVSDYVIARIANIPVDTAKKIAEKSGLYQADSEFFRQEADSLHQQVIGDLLAAFPQLGSYITTGN